MIPNLFRMCIFEWFSEKQLLLIILTIVLLLVTFLLCRRVQSLFKVNKKHLLLKYLQNYFNTWYVLKHKCVHVSVYCRKRSFVGKKGFRNADIGFENIVFLQVFQPIYFICVALFNLNCSAAVNISRPVVLIMIV